MSSTWIPLPGRAGDDRTQVGRAALLADFSDAATVTLVSLAGRGPQPAIDAKFLMYCNGMAPTAALRPHFIPGRSGPGVRSLNGHRKKPHRFVKNW